MKLPQINSCSQESPKKPCGCRKFRRNSDHGPEMLHGLWQGVSRSLSASVPFSAPPEHLISVPCAGVRRGLLARGGQYEGDPLSPERWGKENIGQPSWGVFQAAQQAHFAPCASTCVTLSTLVQGHANPATLPAPALAPPKQTPPFPSGWQSFLLLEGKRRTSSLALPALLLLVTQCSKRRQEPRGWTDLLHPGRHTHARCPASPRACPQMRTQEK